MKLLRILAFAIPVLFLGSCVVMITQWVQYANRPPEIGEDVATVDWLPPEATEINYYRSYTYTAFEFQISEAGFRDWAATVAYPPSPESVYYQPVTEVSELKEKYFFPIARYNDGQDFDQASPDHVGRPEDHTATSIEIEDGLWGQMRQGSAGGYSIGYDRTTGTAYWQSNPR